MGIRIDLDEIRADEFRAMVTLEEEQAEMERAKAAMPPH
jgi:hypothetical protein